MEDKKYEESVNKIALDQLDGVSGGAEEDAAEKENQETEQQDTDPFVPLKRKKRS